MRWRRGVCRRRREALRDWRRQSSNKATRTVAPGATRMRRRMEKMGSRTAPIEFESGRLSMIAIGARTVWLRPRNRALSVSNSGAPTASPSMTVKCAAQISGSLGARFRRVARMAPTSGRYSVSTNSFEKAGCATSALWGARTSSA